MNNTPSSQELRAAIELKLSRYFGTNPKEATKEQIYKASAMTIKDILSARRGNLKENINKKKE